MNTDYLIIGQGLAGSLLAWELIKRNCNVIIIDNGLENASQVAAGLINPITGQRFVKSFGIDYLLPTAKNYYEELAYTFQQSFYIEKTMIRIFNNNKESNSAIKRLDQADYHPYLGKLDTSPNTLNNICSPFGFIEQNETGYLLIKDLLACFKDFFITNECYKQATVAYQDIQIEPLIKWQDITAKRIIFCEGYHSGYNPWFSLLPFQLVKGEILTLRHTQPLSNKILNFGNWLIPLDNQLFRIGATFDRENINDLPTELGKSSLIRSLQTITNSFIEIDEIKHQANIRPCTLDKEPFIGHHPLHPQISIFNGFGAKGSLQLPWYTQKFSDALLKGTPIPSAINRYYATHFVT